MIQRLRNWWSTAHSSLVVHRRKKWFYICLTVVAVWQGWIYSVAFVSVLSLLALVEGSWSAEEAAKAEVRAEERDSP
jgi:hypothetical protein